MPGTKRAIASLILLANVLLGGDSSAGEGISAFHAGLYSVALPKLQRAAKESADPKETVYLALTQAALGDCRTALPNLAEGAAHAAPTLKRLAGIAAARCFSTTGDRAQAFTTIAALEREFPNDPDVLYTSATLHMKAFNDATFAMFQRTPASYRVHELSAQVFETQGRYAEAAAEYRKAIVANPKAPDLHYRLGRSLLAQGHSPESLEEAAQEFQAELALSPEDSAAEYQLGQIAQVRGKSTEAEAHYERAVERSPKFAAALIALGKIQLQKKQYNQALTLLQRAVAIQPDNEAAHYALLTVYRDTGKMEQAKEEKAILDRLQKPPGGEFSDFLKRLGEGPKAQ
jgi:Tfp pilus assembly protein PilF